MNYKERALELKSEIIENRRYLHQTPEIGLELPVTSAYVFKKLEEMGYSPTRLGASGITATVGGKHGGKVVLLRADMDALPMCENSGLDFASQIEQAHTCGHDCHTAMLLGAAKMLKETEDELMGTVKFMFQPAEEILQGAKDMINHGLMENPKVDAAIGAHMQPKSPTGLIAYNHGILSASSDMISITIQGKGGHGASPQDTIDPINVGAHLHIALQELISREISPNEPVVLTFGRFNAGHAENIIPETAELGGTLRTFNKEVRSFMLSRIKEVTDLVARTFRAEAEITFKASTLPMVGDKGVCDIVGPALKELFGETQVTSVNERMNGSEDFAKVADLVPSMFFMLGAGSPDEGYHYGAHHPMVRYNEESLPVGAAAYAHGAAVWLAANK